MAPVAPLGRARALKRVEEGDLPFSFGSPHPTVAIVQQDGKFRVRELCIDEDEAARSHSEAMARGTGWTPEREYALGKPTGQIFAEASTREELLTLMRSMPWPAHW
jgi:hypothetical protein